MLFGLGLWDGFVGADHQHGTVHQRRARQHRRHQGFVPRGVDERNGPERLARRAVRTLLFDGVTLGFVQSLAVTERGVGVAEPDRDPAFHFFAVLVRPRAAERLHQRRLAVVDVTDESDVHLRLSISYHKTMSNLG